MRRTLNGARTAFSGLSARERARAVLDAGTFRELLDPADRFASPHLAAQGLVPQDDDGAVVARGRIGGAPAVAVSLDGTFLGGAVGEVGGAKVAGALELAARDAAAGTPIRPVLLLETGGIRLQEATLGLLAVADIHAAVTDLRRHVPVVGVIGGPIGCFGGMAIAAGLCTRLVMTARGRLGLNGPQVIEEEAGVGEFDAADRGLILRTFGGRRRVADGFADTLVADGAAELRGAVRSAFAEGAGAEESVFRSGHVAASIAGLARHAPEAAPAAAARRAGTGDAGAAPATGRRGGVWIEALIGAPVAPPPEGPASVRVADGELGGRTARFLSVVADPAARWPRARAGEVGLEEGWALAAHVRAAVRADAVLPAGRKRVLVAIVDTPGQAYGYREELHGIHQALAGAVAAYADARRSGHPVVALVVGRAVSGGFLAHGLQADRIVALDDGAVAVQAMSREATARLTRRTIAELDAIARRVPATADDIRSFASLGAVHRLVTGVAADAPGAEDADAVRAALAEAAADARSAPVGLSARLRSAGARNDRAASREVRRRLTAAWGG
ncbi:malonate decarboxylase beta subunit [Nocardiopsis mwathae]|uniref:Malonate decarboxylase beta subunit n=1 Tax=Nocardiopsis mwathae TaxID=1472723 RepID=A0A7X0D4U7_9ACTN|nr:biotin-independent malonate decarboxylase subunit beta [Nocardiopsis mwathae]MBB6171485.1 malonate decarboxylase beta subunit [Nocardiopsis mwathae]